ncbi:DsbA family protein [Magnetococcus sp. PR-3]|uniref:DsbA family protein n=1 Tax=Magnetococcus sp. PR-3 TaxID=3120355 RepID=UPI002FCE1B36
MQKKTLFISSIILVAVGFAIAAMVVGQKTTAKKRDTATNNFSVMERASAPVKGPGDAEVTIVEFLDPACETCAQFYPLVKEIMGHYRGQVRVMVRYAPLHAGSDQVVKMLEAAHLQGKFWPALEQLFSTQNRWVVHHQSQPMRALALLGDVPGLDLEKLGNDMNGARVNAAIAEDVAALQALGVKATPEFFVNGKPMPSFGLPQLQHLVAEAIQAAN